jgi:hypothetical protein
MKILVVTIVMVLMSMTAYADEVFYDRELRTLRVVDASKDNATAWIYDAGGNEAQIYLGDTVGLEGGTVVGIDDASITVQLGNTRMKMLVIKNLLN